MASVSNITFEQRYKENLLSPSSCIPSSGNILKNLSTEAKSSARTASSNFWVTAAPNWLAASCSNENEFVTLVQSEIRENP
jgi:hypothetical protein